MGDIVKTETMVNGQIVEISSNLETDKISEQLEDVSVKVNDLLTSFIGRDYDDDNDSLSQSSDECQCQNNNSRPTGGSRDASSDDTSECVSRGATTNRSEALSRGKRHKMDNTSCEKS